MSQVTIKDRTYQVTPTGLKNVAYKLQSGRLQLSGIRNQNDPDLIIAMDKSNRVIGYFSESRLVEMVTINA